MDAQPEGTGVSNGKMEEEPMLYVYAKKTSGTSQITVPSASMTGGDQPARTASIEGDVAQR